MRLALITWLAGAVIAFGQTMAQQAEQPMVDQVQSGYIHTQVLDGINDSVRISIEYASHKDSKEQIVVISSKAIIDAIGSLNRVYRCI